MLHNQNLYTAYPNEYGDLYKYSPTFALLMAPFAILPDWLGLTLWNALGAFVLFIGLRKLMAEQKHFNLLLVFLIAELFLTTANSQSNALITGCILLAFHYLETGRSGIAAFFIMLTVFIKLFTLVVLILFLFYPSRIRNGLFVIISTLVLLVLPLIVISASSLYTQYHNWAELLERDHSISHGIGLLGFLNSLKLFPVSKSGVLVSGIMVVLFPLVRYKYWSNLFFKQNYLCLLLLWMVVFNHKAESPSYIIAMSGTALWAHFNGFSKPTILFLILAFVFTSLASTDLCPKTLRENFIEPYCIKSLFPSLLVFSISLRLTILRVGPAKTKFH